MPTLESTLQELRAKRHLLAVFNALVQFIDEELADHDTRKASAHLIAEDNSEVDQEAVDMARDLLMENHVGPLEEEILGLLGREVG